METTKEKRAKNLLKLLGAQHYTQRHLKIIDDFLASGEEDVTKLLDQLGEWDESDLKRAEEWMRTKLEKDGQTKNME